MWNVDAFFFSNMGQKIKAVVRALFYFVAGLLLVGGIAAEIYGLSMLLDGNDNGWLVMIATPIAVAVGIGITWLAVFLAYGFGEVVDTAIVIRGTPQEESVDLTAVNPFDIAQTDGEEDADDVWLCPHCEGDLVAHPATGMWYCPDCGKQYRVEGAGWTKRLVEMK